MRAYLSLSVLVTLSTTVAAVVSCGSDDKQPRPAYYQDDPNEVQQLDGGTSSIDPCTVEGHEGCPCSEDGAVIDCGRIDYVNGDYVNCSMGQATCTAGKWGACIGNRLVAQSLKGHALTPAGRRLLGVTQSCNSPCDPKCTRVVGVPTDVDAGLLTFTDAGVTLTQTVGAGPNSGPCKGLWCNVDACPGQAQKTSVSGVVYDPAGKVPLYNAYVYIPVDPALALPGFTDGVSCDTCAGATDVSAVAVAQTGADGKFTLNNVPYGDGIPLVVQMGKWRRRVTLPTITKCQNNPLPATHTRLPRNRFDGDGNQADIPRMAIASGSADPFECLLLKAGIDANEIKAPGNNTRIDYYVYNGKDRSPGGAPAGSTLTSSVDTLKKYDVVLLPCEGAENTHNTQAPNIVTYTGLGGRMFTTHYGYVWLATPSSKNTPSNLTNFYGTANWKLGLNDYSDPMTASVDQTFPKGAAFAQWMQNVGATTTLGKPSLNEPRHNALTAISPSQRWVYGTSNNTTASYRDMLLSMTFNTPVGVAADKQCGRVVFSDFHVSADALVSGTTCSADTDCGFGTTCNPAVAGTCAPKTCTSSTTCASGYSCVGATQGSCSTQACYTSSQCGTGRTCSGTTGVCGTGCYQSSECGSSWWSTCNGGALGTCAAGTCKSDTECGNGTCNGETIGSCVPATTGCWNDTGCKGLNASSVCSGAVLGNCSNSCKNSTDCGGSTCSNAAPGRCQLATPATCTTNTDCTAKNAATSCLGVVPGKCSVATCKQNSDCSSNSCNGATPGKCRKNGTVYSSSSCWSNSDCTSYSNNAVCDSPAPVVGKCNCMASAQCTSGGTCGGITAGTCQANTASCWSASDCSAYGSWSTCVGATLGTCPAKTCTATSDCGGTRTCSGQTQGTCTGPTKTCWDVSDCASLGAQYSCSGAVVGNCTTNSCDSNSDCGAARACNGAKRGYCAYTNSGNCGTDTDCASGKVCIGGAMGTCSVGNCYSSTDCGTSGTCSAGSSLGSCQKACTSSTQCGSLTCASGLCQGCTADNQCASGNCVGDVARTCSASSSMFPLSCRNGDLSGQEKALEFMLFDLTACVSPDSWAPPVPSISYTPVTFTLDFEAKCDTGQMAIWRELDWKAEVPAGTNIAFSAQTAANVTALATAQSTPLATATSSTVLPGWDVAILETTTGGAFFAAVPRIVSLPMLRITVTLNPSADKKAAPTLNTWQVGYDCLDKQ